MRISSQHHRLRMTRKGASATELAVILPVLMTIVLGTVDFGRFVYHHIAVTNAARAGAEYATMNPYVSAGQGTWQSQIQAHARAELTNQVGCDPTLLTTTVTVTVEQSGLRRVKVEATYDSFQTVVSWPGLADSVTLQSSVVMRAIR